MVAGNGDLQRLERTITETTLQDVTFRDSAPEDVVARIDAAVNACRVLGHEGKMIDETSTAFAQHLEELLQEFHTNISDRLREMAKTIGRLGKFAPPAS